MSALSDLRRTRRNRRLGDTEWFDLAYRVYLAAFFGGGAVIVLADYVGDVPLSDSAITDVFTRGPAMLGLLAAIALAIGLRSGAEGGPISIEPADVRHLLLAPVSRGAVLRNPLFQRFRTVIGTGAIAGGILGLLIAQRLPGTTPAWTLSGAAFGACIGAINIAAAAIWHGLRVSAWPATVIGAAAVAWQAVAASDRVSGFFSVGPFDAVGSLALWGYRGPKTDLIGVAAIIIAIVAAMMLAGRLRVEHLERRGDLVSQLRFAVTMQDLRTVVLLRRQLRQEQLRSRPWIRLQPSSGSPTGAAVRRGLYGLLRMPAARLGRMVALSAVSGVLVGLVLRGTTPMLAVLAVAIFVLGLDLIEPLSQEIDHPDRTGGLPCEAGWLHERLLIAPLLLAIPAAMVGAAVCALIAPDAAAGAFVFAVPVTWSGIAGASVSAIRDIADAPSTDGLMVPPEMAGMRDAMRTALPVIVAGIGTLIVLAMRETPTVDTGVRAGIGLLLYLGLVRLWIVHRSALKQKWQNFAADAKQGTTA